jgi:L-alanine-DL-glutamate epimerase-like enolase superfamily enzyme
MSLQIVELRAEPLTIPMKSPFESAKRRSTEAENVLVTARLENGVTGRGEASPAFYVTGEDRDAVLAAIPEASAALTGQDAARVQRWSAALREALPKNATACSAIEMALLDALTRSWGVPLWVYFGGAVQEVRSDLTIPITDSENAGALAAEAAAFGYRSLKIKVGGPDRDEDLRRVRAVSGAAPGAGIRLDANQGFAPKEALEFLAACERAGVPVEIMEQPVPRDDWDGLAEVTRGSKVPVIADEAVVDARAAVRVAATGAAHGINIKVAKAGLLGALQIIAIARAAGLKLMLGCMLESLLGIGASLHLACGTGAFDYLDLDAHSLIGLKAEGRPFHQERDVLRVTDAPGLSELPEPPPASSAARL